MKTIEPKRSVHAALDLPGSKSMTHRALIAAALAEGPSLIEAPLFSEDTRYTLDALRFMGASVQPSGDDLAVAGINGGVALPSPEATLFLGNSGTSMRLLLSVAALGHGRLTLDGSERMRERPLAPLVEALRALGAAISYAGRPGCPPVRLEARGLDGGTVKIPAAESSQYLSSLLLAAPYARDTVEIEAVGPLLSRPYVDMTRFVMEAFGVRVESSGPQSFLVPKERRYHGRRFRIEADLSSASYFWAAAAVTGGSVTIRNVRPFETCQGDVGFLDLLEAMGCAVLKEPDAVTVQGGPLEGIEADMNGMPDMVPTLAAVAPFAEGRTTIRNVPHLRFKESDRLRSVTRAWRRLGAQVRELPDGLEIDGGKSLTGAVVDPENDHRLAMSLAVIGLRTPGVRILNEDCVQKSFPGFWTLFDAL